MPPRRKVLSKKSTTKEDPVDVDQQSNEADGARSEKRSARLNKSRERATSKLDESMKSAKSVATEESQVSPNPVVLQAQHEAEIQLSFSRITEEIIDSCLSGTSGGAVTSVMKRTLVMHMRKAPALFQKTLLSFIERLLTLDVGSQESQSTITRQFQVLLMHTYSELVKHEKDRQNGAKLIKSVLRHLLEIYCLPKLAVLLQTRVSVFIANLIAATSFKNPSDANIPTKKKAQNQRTFTLLDPSRADQDLSLKLEETVIQMLSPQSTTAIQTHGIAIAGLISNHTDETIFKQLMRLLLHSKSATIRSKIIKSLRVPYSAPALAFLGKRLRDTNQGIVQEIFEQLTEAGVSLKDFPTPESRMLVLIEGLTSTESKIRSACITFLTPTVLQAADSNDLASVLKLIEARLAFGNQYFGRMPGLMVLAILEILEQDTTLAQYLDTVVMAKLKRMAGIPLGPRPKRTEADGETEAQRRKRDLDEFDLFGDSGPKESKRQSEGAASSQVEKFRDSMDQDGMEVDQEGGSGELSLGPVTFEEVLLLRLTYELNRGMSHQRSGYFLDKLADLMPEFEDYRKITFALAAMPEPNLPYIDPKEDKIQPYPRGQVGFTRRAILGEWVKFSLQMNIKDETIRSNLTSLCFQLVGKIEYSFDDYEHLLKRKTQLLSNGAPNAADGAVNLAQRYMAEEEGSDGDIDSDIEALLDKATGQRASEAEFRQETENQAIEITIRNFDNIGTTRSLQEYCKPFAMESLTQDFDDVCQMAVQVAKTLLNDRVDEFQLKIMEAISDVKETVQDDGANDPFSAHKPPSADMMFSQIPQQQMVDQGQIVCYPRLRAKFMRKIQQKVETCESLNAYDDEYDIAAFNKTYRQMQIYVQLIEETHLKEKLSYKRALILCRSLLKQCRLANINDQNVISICENIVHPCVEAILDKEKLLLAFECIGLFSILDKELFLNYSKIFTQILSEDLDPEKDNKREKVIAIKSVVDGLIIHGIADEDVLDNFFDILTGQYLSTKDRVLRQVTTEGVCKMLFTPRLCEQNDPRRVEAVLVQLIVSMFDKQYSPKNSLVSSILSQFFRNFAPFSHERCHMLLNALTKVVYSALRSRYGLKAGVSGKAITTATGGKKGQAKNAAAKKPKGKKKASSYDSEESDFSEEGYDSDDSAFHETKVAMRQVLESLDLVKMTSLLMFMLSRDLVNEYATRKLKQELTVTFFLRLLSINKTLFEKTAIVKDLVQHVLELVRVESCDSLPLLRKVDEKWTQQAKMLVSTTTKVSKFQDRLNQRIQELEEIEEANQQCDEAALARKSNATGLDVEMAQNDQKDPTGKDELQSDDSFDLSELSRFWDSHIIDKILDRGGNEDRELISMQQIWLDQLDLTNLSKSRSPLSPTSKSATKKSILKSPSNFKMRLGHVDGFEEDSEGKGADNSSTIGKQPMRSRRQRQQKEPTGSNPGRSGKGAGALHSIKEEDGGSRNESFVSGGQPRKGRRVRILEEKKEVMQRPQRQTARATKQSYKSEITEDEEDQESSLSDSENESDLSHSGSGEYSASSKPGADEASVHQSLESESDQSNHDDFVKDSLGYIARNISNTFARNSKRLSAGEKITTVKKEQQLPTDAYQQQSSGLSVLKIETKARSSTGFKSVDPTSLKKEPDSERRGQKGQLITRRRRRSQSSQSAASQAEGQSQSGGPSGGSQAALSSEEDDGDSMYDFMDGKLTKQLKQQRKAAKEQAKAPVVASKGRMRSKKRQVKQE